MAVPIPTTSVDCRATPGVGACRRHRAADGRGAGVGEGKRGRLRGGKGRGPRVGMGAYRDQSPGVVVVLGRTRVARPPAMSTAPPAVRRRNSSRAAHAFLFPGFFLFPR